MDSLLILQSLQQIQTIGEVLPLFCERGTYPVIIGDKGYISEKLEKELLEYYNVCLLPTRRTNQKEQYPKSFRKLHQKIRRRIETTISQLSEQFNIGRIRARTHWGFRTRLSNKFSGFTLGVFLNKCFRTKVNGTQRCCLRIIVLDILHKVNWHKSLYLKQILIYR